MKLIKKIAGLYIYESQKKLNGLFSRTRKYAVERYPYPANLWYYPSHCGAFPMHYTWIVSVVEIDDVTGEVFFLDHRNMKACESKMQSPWKTKMVATLKAIDNGEMDNPFTNDYVEMASLIAKAGGE